MKILYITGARGMDYMNDLLFHGLHELYGANVVDSKALTHMYLNMYPKRKVKRLYGLGFSIINSIPNDEVDREDISSKINKMYYDYVIYGQIHRCSDYLGQVLHRYPTNRIAFIDGEDEQFNCGILVSKKHIYFKREIIKPRNNMFPISFAFIRDRIVSNPGSIKKSKKYGTVIPGDKRTYKFKREDAYYADYQKSYFGKTCKKAGWDCMRHYEILANYCMPHFVDLAECPEHTMTNYPKALGIEANKLAEAENLDQEKYFALLGETFEYFRSHMTTVHLAKYVINTLDKMR